MSEILKSLWSKLYAWALPSALTLGAFWLIVFPQTTIGRGWLHSISDTEKTTAFIALSAAISFSLYAFSSPLYRVLEGYLLWPRALQEIGMRRQLARKRKLQEAISDSGWRRGLALEKLARYPIRDEQVVPTKFGNALRAFETYGKTRFNLDSQSLWYELCAVAPKCIQTEINSARASVDFFVTLTYLSAFLGATTLILAIHDGYKASLLISGITSLATSFLWHWLAVRATSEWGYTIQALVNIGRAKLADALGLQLPDCLDKEKIMWGLVTKYSFYGRDEDGDTLDQFRKKLLSTESVGCEDGSEEIAPGETDKGPR